MKTARTLRLLQTSFFLGIVLVLLGLVHISRGLDVIVLLFLLALVSLLVVGRAVEVIWILCGRLALTLLTRSRSSSLAAKGVSL